MNKDKAPVQLSPFEVVEDTKGYFAANTMSGTRFNSKLEDLGAAITVITKEQMSDFAMLDINDVFLYSTSTEGSGDYPDFAVNNNGHVADNVQNNPRASNRIRGIGSANISMGNIGMSGLTPIDPLNIEGIEISRGRNANVFGLGSPGGTLNMVPAQANLSKNKSTVSSRTFPPPRPTGSRTACRSGRRSVIRARTRCGGRQATAGRVRSMRSPTTSRRR